MQLTEPIKSIRLSDGVFADRLTRKYGWRIAQPPVRDRLVHREEGDNGGGASPAAPVQLSISHHYPAIPLHVKLMYMITAFNRLVQQHGGIADRGRREQPALPAARGRRPDATQALPPEQLRALDAVLPVDRPPLSTTARTPAARVSAANTAMKAQLTVNRISANGHAVPRLNGEAQASAVERMVSAFGAAMRETAADVHRPRLPLHVQEQLIVHEAVKKELSGAALELKKQGAPLRTLSAMLGNRLQPIQQSTIEIRARNHIGQAVQTQVKGKQPDIQSAKPEIRSTDAAAQVRRQREEIVHRQPVTLKMTEVQKHRQELETRVTKEHEHRQELETRVTKERERSRELETRVTKERERSQELETKAAKELVRKMSDQAAPSQTSARSNAVEQANLTKISIKHHSELMLRVSHVARHIVRTTTYTAKAMRLVHWEQAGKRAQRLIEAGELTAYRQHKSAPLRQADALANSIAENTAFSNHTKTQTIKNERVKSSEMQPMIRRTANLARTLNLINLLNREGTSERQLGQRTRLGAPNVLGNAPIVARREPNKAQMPELTGRSAVDRSKSVPAIRRQSGHSGQQEAAAARRQPGISNEPKLTMRRQTKGADQAGLTVGHSIKGTDKPVLTARRRSNDASMRELAIRRQSGGRIKPSLITSQLPGSSPKPLSAAARETAATVQLAHRITETITQAAAITNSSRGLATILQHRSLLKPQAAAGLKTAVMQDTALTGIQSGLGAERLAHRSASKSAQAASSLLAKEVRKMKEAPLDVAVKPAVKEAPQKDMINGLQTAIKTVEKDLHQAKVQWTKSNVDVKRLTDQIYRELSKRIRLDQQRRGL